MAGESGSESGMWKVKWKVRGGDWQDWLGSLAEERRSEQCAGQEVVVEDNRKEIWRPKRGVNGGVCRGPFAEGRLPAAFVRHWGG